MTSYLVQERSGSSSPNHSPEQHSSHDFGGVEMQALSIVHSSPELEASAFPDTAAEFDRLSTTELQDLGDALATMLAPSPDQNTASMEDSALSPPSPSIASGSSPGEKSALSSISSQDLDVVSAASLGSPENGAPLDSKSPPSSDSEEDHPTTEDYVKKNGKIIKLPQRKGGMQLWQFLYALLSDPQYKDLIEWTSNVKEREFRLHEPEAIAVWWGDHKNKRNMSYDKLSRSLRYYYDKGIIRKINGQRYVYRFCVAPEVMYRHIGNSDCRPRLKPMPISAQNALSTANNAYQPMMCPPHVPGGMYGGPYCPPYPNHLSYQSYPPPYPQFPVTTAASDLNGVPGMPIQMSYQPELNSLQPHLLSPVKNCGHHLRQTAYMGQGMLDSYSQAGYPGSMDESAGFHSLLSDGTPSPQPVSPQSLPSSFLNLSPRSYSPLTPPPYTSPITTSSW